MRQYLNALSTVLEEGIQSEDRTNTGTLSCFSLNMKFDLQKGFPITTTKKMWWFGVVKELLWMLSGSTNVNDLPKSVQKIWRPWANEDGSLGPTYGKQFRNIEYNGKKIDQVARAIQKIQDNPFSRRHIISLWSPHEVEDMNLPPCHGNHIQFWIREGKLSCHMLQRSGDMFLGVPWNISFYSLLVHAVAHLCGLKPATFSHTIIDAHIYLNHIDQVREQLSRDTYPLPTLKINRNFKSIDDIKYKDFELVNYKHHPPISAPMAI